jgi:hypothetical protein
MNADHFAIVIGLASYPRLGDPPPADLRGPENDADAVFAWLSDANGGALPKDNIRVIRSRDQQSPPNPAPTREDLEETFLWLDGVAAANQTAGKGRKVGTRLYFYVSGHGFSPGFRAGCLLAGNAAERQFSANIFPSAWVDWLRDAEYFSEYILWMDCCMDRQVLTPPAPPPLAPIGGGGGGKTFIAFAAPRPLKAAEKEIPPGSNQWHGVFTWNLLEGLRGAAANQFGLVTAVSLADWLRQSQLGWLDSTDRSNPSVAKEPSIVEKDDSIAFAKGIAPRAFDITLNVSNSTTPTDIRLWSGSPPNAGSPIRIAPGGTLVQLTPGLYLAEGVGLRHGFAVTRSMTIELTEQGDPIRPSNGKFTLQVDPGDPSADITVTQSRFNVVMGGKAQLVCPPLDFGLYQFRVVIGRQIVEKVILLDRDWPPPGVAPGAMVPPLPQITSAAPLPGTRATHEYQQEAARQATVSTSTNEVRVDSGAELMVMSRLNGQAPTGRMPWQGVAILNDQGEVAVNLETQGRHDVQGDPTAVFAVSLPPGAYKLQYPVASGTLFAQSVLLPPGDWRAEAYILYDARDQGARPSVSLLMRKLGADWGTADDVQLQKALVALADERPIQDSLLSDLLAGKSFNPLAAVVSAHLLLLSAESPAGEATVDLRQLDKLIILLRNNIGSDHPDVEALSLRCHDPELHTSKPIRAPPIFERSWELLLKASETRPELIPSDLWKQVHVRVAAPPYLVWCPDATVQAAYTDELAKTLFHQRPSPAVAASAPPSAAERIAHAVEAGIGDIASHALRDIGGAAIATKFDEWLGTPQHAPAPSGVSDQEVARRARDLHVPPAALEVLRQEFGMRSASAQAEPERGVISSEM